MRNLPVRAPRLTRRVAFLFGFLVLLPAIAGAQTPTLTAVWDPSPASDRVSQYEVCIGTTSLSCNVRLATVSANDTSYEFQPTPGQLMYVAVRAVNPSGRSAYSTEQRFSIPSINSLADRSSVVNAGITAINVGVSDPDGSSLTFTHTGLPVGVTLNRTTGQITGTPTSAGSYNVTIFVTDGLATVSESFLWTITAAAAPDRTPPALTITSHTSGAVVTSASATIRGTATDSGNGDSGITTVRVNGQSATGGSASGSNTANWSRAITLSSGSNTISVEATDGAGNVQMRQITLQLAVASPPANNNNSSGPLVITGLSSNRTSPQVAGTAITFTAAATGGRGGYQFKWWYYDGVTWTMVRDWSTSTTYTWTPSQAGSGYRIGIWARDGATTTDVGNVNLSVPFAITAPPAPTPVPPSTPPASTGGPLQITSLTSNRTSPQVAGTSITFTAAATGGRGGYQFKWWYYDGITWTMVRDWSSSTTYTWTPSQAGSGYRIGIWARDGSTTADVSNVNLSVPFVISAASTPAPPSTPPPSSGAPLQITSITANRTSPQVAGTSITFTAAATGGPGGYQFKWWLFDGTTWTMVRDWSSSATYTWTPSLAGAGYRIGIWARGGSTTADVSNVNLSVPFIITAPSTPPIVGFPLQVASLTSNLSSPQRLGATITFTAAATGGRGPYQYKWWVYDGTTWTMVRNWSSSSTFTWTPPVGRTEYRIGIWVRDSTTTADVSNVNYSVPFLIR